ncbi:mannitol dehydrogenase family protein [Leifsonia sp. EB34]|uniref:mannitol dehydrogenase family protein n=1 Tax=Leifsonia sp. EB34 TaxID=3156303 RepID=UPI003515F0D8
MYSGTLTRLSRAALDGADGVVRPKPEVRIVHLGLGAFHRAHQAWYTAAVDPAGEWGIAAFTGRTPDAALELAPQDGLFTLVVRSPAEDEVSVVRSIAEASDGADLARLVARVRAPRTAVVTLTITEPGYRLTPDGRPRLDDGAVVADIERLRQAFASADDLARTVDGPVTALGRLLLALEARRRAGSGPLAVVPCDNIPGNGRFVARGLDGLARQVSDETADWIAATVSFVSTSVDRITPRTTEDDIRGAARLTGWDDHAVVVTEPFTDWVLCGDFPAGRPAWEDAGARFVADIEPFEQRKLRLLNGAHSLLAYAGLSRGYRTVAQAVADPALRARVEAYWNESVRHLPAEGLDLRGYRDALIERFANARIEHNLEQIAAEAVAKLRVRIVGTLLAERAAGRSGSACVYALAAWVALVRSGRALVDAESAAISEARASADATSRLLALIDPRLAADPDIVAAVDAARAASFHRGAHL